MIRAAVALFPPLLLALVLLADWSADWRVVPALLAGWFAADLASGIVHMLMDYIPTPRGVGLDRMYFYSGDRGSEDYARLRRQVFGRIGPVDRLLFDFKVHHPRPESLGRRSFFYQSWSTILFLSLPLSLLLLAVALVATVPGWIMAGALAFILGGTFSQYFHGSLHRESNPWIVDAMRRAGLLMTPAAHDLHHRSLQRDFATISGWSNPLLNILFRALRARGFLPDEGLEPR